MFTLPDSSSLEDPADDYSHEKLTRRALSSHSSPEFWRHWKREYLGSLPSS